MYPYNSASYIFSTTNFLFTVHFFNRISFYGNTLENLYWKSSVSLCKRYLKTFYQKLVEKSPCRASNYVITSGYRIARPWPWQPLLSYQPTLAVHPRWKLRVFLIKNTLNFSYPVKIYSRGFFEFLQLQTWNVHVTLPQNVNN